MDALFLSNHLAKLLHDLRDPNTTPEMALQLLPSAAYRRVDIEPLVIFHACIKYIINRLRPGGYVDGVWEDFIRKTVIFSRYYTQVSIMFLRRYVTDSDVLADHNEVMTWLGEALSIPSNCPNPYTRLELFLLVKTFCNSSTFVDWRRMCDTFMQTICEIKPQNLYPNISVKDINGIIGCLHKPLQIVISTDIRKQLYKTNAVIMNSDETRFIVSCIQLIGVFALNAKTYEDNHTILETVGSLVDCGELLYDVLHRMSPLEQRQHYVVSHPPFRQYVVEALLDITQAIKNACGDRILTDSLRLLRHNVSIDLDVFTKAAELPKLMLQRQIHGPTTTIQKELILKYSLSLKETGDGDESLVKDDTDEEYDDYDDSLGENSDYSSEERSNS
ncbi:unnamed protein product [Meganyctiphanes norvegica]|uniref:Uncharacterized protein n=1 Tax=Meganyctiphanes norvegica TaxID=48144 RepID=A0AAV2Q4A2_MEGNR